MPFEISIAIDPSGKLRNFIRKSCKKPKFNPTENSKDKVIETEKNEETPSKLTNTNSLIQSDYVTVYNTKGCEIEQLVIPLNECVKGDEGRALLKENGNTIEKRVWTGVSKNIKKIYFVDSKSSIPRYFKKFFVATRKEHEPVGGKPVCETATDAFKTILKDESNLNKLVGKEFTLNTIVTIKSVEDQGQPNLVLTGTIPFQFVSENGVEHKQVRVKGKLYSSRKEGSNQILSEKTKSANSTQFLSICKVNEQFKLDSSVIKEVNWLTSKVFTQQEYEQYLQSSQPKYEKGESNLGLIRHKHVSDFDERERSTNILEPGNKKIKERDLVNNTDTQLKHGKFKNMKLPVTSITITRSKTRLIKFTDGTDYTEKVGRNVVTLAAPKGILYFPGEKLKDMEGNVDKIKPNDNVNTPAYFQMTRDENTYTCSQSLACTKKCLPVYEMKESEPCTKELGKKNYYPANDYTEILKDKYNPLTWVYKHFDKTKRFVREFSVVE